MIDLTPRKRAVITIANTLLGLHGLRAWGFALFRGRSRVGLCRYPRIRRGQPGRILINEFFCENNPIATVIEAILHEISHALTPGHQHDEVWRQCCLKLGISTNEKSNAVMPGPRYRAFCQDCHIEARQDRRPRPNEVNPCVRCGTHLEWIKAKDPKWLGECPSCHHQVRRFFPPLDEPHPCPNCPGWSQMLVWRQLGTLVGDPSRQPNANLVRSARNVPVNSRDSR